MQPQNFDFNLLWQFGFIGVISFGLTFMVCAVRKHFDKEHKEVLTIYKMLIQGVFAFLLYFVPLEAQNIIFDALKVAVGVVAGMSTFWQFAKVINGR